MSFKTTVKNKENYHKPKFHSGAARLIEMCRKSAYEGLGLIDPSDQAWLGMVN